ncbi:MAG TPA: NAD(P)/FAD-dependent oxidoreductase [Oceanospirillales bacterium]|nr:NAD(P)/FAD-dependent oxidoreductase [Oceanospirillales bacterium]
MSTIKSTNHNEAHSKSALSEKNKRILNFRNQLFQKFDSYIQDQHKQAKINLTKSKFAKSSNNEVHVGIVGGGMAGMYASLMLDKLNIKSTIFEASGERLGGRVYSYYFNDGPHQYAELGAMRFPHSELQSRLFSFWDYLNKTAPKVANAKEIVKIPYILYDDNPNLKAGDLLKFNERKPVTRNQAEQDNSLLGFDQFFAGPQWDYFKDENGQLKSAQTLLDNAVEKFVSIFEKEGIDKAWIITLQYNSYSAREYLQEVGDGTEPYPVEIVDYMETVLTYTGIYDLAFIELILDTYSFENTQSWSAMDGGTSRISEEMLNRIPSESYKTGRTVVKLSENKDKAVIHYNSGKGTQTHQQEFDRVIVTLPFSVLRFVQTPESWSAGKYQAIRSLKMTNAVKVALGFKSRFWEKPGPYSEGMKGGQSNTDLASRSIVYPSFGIGQEGPAYLLSSYCWQDDADKFSHLSEAQILAATLEDVVSLHGEIAREEYLGNGTSIVWNKEELAGGGFEFFAAGQFGKMFVDARVPEGRFNFAGEHLDMVHYWIAGSYDSAFRTVWETLILEGLDTPENLKILFNSLGGGDIFPTMIPIFNSHSKEKITQWLQQTGS